ncbi:MAG: TrkA C-terminal domain-containing protein [Lachnospiraceae bacterium]|nr:TrkA C-terminal domain-containing protein [Lachnospiraceae bacterium]
MNIYLAFTLFTFTGVVYLFIAEVFTMLFRFTGLPAEKARFQVSSLLTGCGFTTHESELFLSSKSRRRLARYTMLFGYVFNITIVTAFINVFFSLKLSQILSNTIALLIPAGVILAVVLVIRIPKIRRWWESIIERLAGRITHQGNENTLMMIDQIGRDSIVQVVLNKVPEEFEGKMLKETQLKSAYHINVLLIDRGQILPGKAESIFQKGDKLTLFGEYASVCKAFQAKERFTEDADPS